MSEVRAALSRYFAAVEAADHVLVEAMRGHPALTMRDVKGCELAAQCLESTAVVLRLWAEANKS